MTLNEWYEKGMSVVTYIESMEKNKDGLVHIYDNFSLPEDKAFHQKLMDKNLRAIVLTEDWCGDAMVNMPVLLRLSEAANIDVKVLLRDHNLELMDQYLTNGKSRSIPIFIFIDESGNEVAKWGPRAQKVQEFIDESLKALPDKEAPNYKDKFNEMIMFTNKSFRENTDFWDEIYKSLKQTLQNI